MGNNALNLNGFSNNSGSVDNHITVRGSNWLFTVCAVMGKLHIALIFAVKLT